MERTTMPTIRYRLTFARPGGCPIGVLDDMARFDRAKVTSMGNDLRCEPRHFRQAILISEQMPTMERWASFGLSTALKVMPEAADSHPALPPPQLASDAIVPQPE